MQITGMTARRAIGGAVAAAACAGLAHAAPPINDDCSTPISISGAGTHNYDLTEATTGVEGQDSLSCQDATGASSYENDVWFCWTADCTGIVTINTCGQTQMNTKIALWRNCDCPTPGVDPLCCNDDACDLQSAITCEVICGEQYLIHIGKVADGLPPGPGSFTIDCEGEPCDPGSGMCLVEPGVCCAGRPAYEDPDFAAFTGQIAVGTASPSVIGGNVVTVFDYSDFSTAIPNTNFNVARYSHPDWTAQTLGSIFGLALDAAGNIYVTPTITYLIDQVGSGGMGAVYRLDAVTGAVTVHATLPNDGEGLGNVAYDCANDQLFVTNFADGKIYRIDMLGNVLSTFDHGTPDDPTTGIAPLGDRPWGITVHAGRVWYGLWTEDSGRPSATASNEIWSIALDGFGDFTGAEQLEVTMPPIPPVGAQFSPPVSDIRFTPAGTLQCAERGMTQDSDPWDPHNARLLEFSCENGVWVAGPAAFGVGEYGNQRNCSGGLDVDYGPNARTWVSGNALHFGLPHADYIYGYQGTPTTGGGVSTSWLVDYNGITNDFGNDKMQLGDIEITCAEPECLTWDAEIECEIGPVGFTGKYLVSLTLTNNSGTDAQYVLLPGDQTVPNVITLNPVLPGDGSQSQTVMVTICDAQAGQFCFDIVLADEKVVECCAAEICLDLPDCDCMIFPEDSIVVGCDPSGWTLSFDFTNLTSDVIEHLFMVPLPVGTNVTVTPDYVDLAAVGPGGTASVGPFLIQGAANGAQICIRVTIHNENLQECCSEVICITLPDCGPPVPCDLDGDGVVAFSDLLIVLADWGGCCAGDVNGDGITGFADLLEILSWM